MREVSDLPVADTNGSVMDGIECPPRIAGSVLDGLSDGVLRHDTSGRIVEWNDAAGDILGVTDERFDDAGSTSPLAQAVHADGSLWPLETQPAQLALYGGRVTHDETMGLRRDDDRFIWLRVNAYVTRDDVGDVIGATTIFNDITEVLEQATSQGATQRRFVTTFDSSPVANLIVSLDGTFLAANPAFATLVGRSVAELFDIDRFGLAEQGISMHLFNALTSPQRNGTNAASFEYCRPDGEVRHGLTQICAIDWPGSDQCSMVQVVDITELAQSRIELERSVNLFQATFESSPIGLQILGLDGVVKRANPAMGRLLGVPAAEVTGKSVDAFVHPDDLQRVKQFVARGSSRTALAIDHRIVRMDGETRWWRAYVTPIETAEGPALLGQAIDHTAERRRDIINQSIDPLTGLLTRERLIATIEDRVFAEAVSVDHPVAVIVADIVDFKGVNDRLGPEGADRVLRRMGATIRSSLPADAEVARIGPDMFAVGVFGMGADAVTAAVTLLERRLAENEPDQTTPHRAGGDEAGNDEIVNGEAVNGEAVNGEAGNSEAGADDTIKVRLGAVVVTRLDSSPDDLLHRAEAASRSIADQPVILASDGTPASQRWSEALEQALTDRHFFALAEPLAPLSACKPLRRFELLVRLVMPDGQSLALPKFDRLAQRLGCGPVVDHWMIGHAIDLLTADSNLELEVNIAPSNVGDRTFVSALAGHLSERGTVAERLVLALTEQTVVDDVTAAMRFSDAARALGVRIALDEYIGDEGGGNYLESLGISRVKLNGKLIRDAVHGSAERKMVAELARTAHASGVEVAAPFVSDAHMIDELRLLGVDFAQGRSIGSPVPAASLVDVPDAA